jgi:hypothetical protein
MNRNLRFLAGGLSAVAVASGVTLAAPSAYAADGADRPCGQPAVPAMLVTVVAEPVTQLVPEVAHQEWRWQRDVTTWEHQYSRVVTAAHTVTDWVRPATVASLWSRKVVERAAVDAVPATAEQGHYDTVVVTPAVTVTVFEYVQQQTGHTRWEDAGWNAETADGDNGRGWTRTGETREDVVTPAVTTQVWVVDHAATPGAPAVPELSHVDETWSETSPGPDWTGPIATHDVPGATATTDGDDTPAGSGWIKAGSHAVPAVVDFAWGEDAPDGYVATGQSRIKEVATEQTSEHSATAPADGWTQVPGSEVRVVDRPATTVVIPGTTREVQVPELPATPACASAAPVAQFVVSPVAGGHEPAVHATVQRAHHADHHAHHAQSGNHAAAAGTATVLPETGNPVSPVLLTAGLGALLAGGALVRVGRRRQTD